MTTLRTQISTKIHGMSAQEWQTLKAHQQYGFKHYFMLLCQTDELLLDGMKPAKTAFKNRQLNLNFDKHTAAINNIKLGDNDLFSIQHFIVLMHPNMWKRTKGYAQFGTKAQLLNTVRTFVELCNYAEPLFVPLDLVHSGETISFVEPDGTYTGQTDTTGLAHGYGEQVQTNGIVYRGVWNHGKRDVFGYETYEDIENYIGQYVNGMISGAGKYTFDTVFYDGEFKNDMINGFGTFDSETDITKGTFINGKRHGLCKVSLSDGSAFEGQFDNDVSTYGKIIYKNGNKFQGNVTVVNRTYSECVIMPLPNGIVSIKPHGNGTLLDSENNAYIGEFNNGRIKLTL